MDAQQLQQFPNVGFAATTPSPNKRPMVTTPKSGNNNKTSPANLMRINATTSPRPGSTGAKKFTSGSNSNNSSTIGSKTASPVKQSPVRRPEVELLRAGNKQVKQYTISGTIQDRNCKSLSWLQRILQYVSKKEWENIS